MKIAIDVSPLSTGHKIRGVGFYLKHLLEALKKYHPEHDYIEFTKTIPRGVDVVHYPYFDPFFHTLPFFPHANTVVTIHDVTPLVFPQLFPIGIKGKVNWFLQQKSLQAVKRIITDSMSSQKDIQQILQRKPEDIDVVYLAAAEQFRKISNPKSQISNLKKKYNLPEKFALYVGDATPNKNLPNMIKAILRTNVQLVMVGKTLTDTSVDLSNPWTRDIREVRDLAEKNPDKIHMLGFVEDEDVVALYTSASVFLMPSLYEGFGLPVVEAMSCGCPVITTNKGSLKEVAQDAAVIVDPENIDEIAQAIQKIVGNKTYAKKLSEKGLQQAKKFSWKKTADETIASYKKTLSS